MFSLEKTRLCIVATEEMSDDDVFRMIVNTEIESANDLLGLIDYVEKYRPEIAKRLTEVLGAKAS
jgi:hypothetical protein